MSDKKIFYSIVGMIALIVLLYFVVEQSPESILSEIRMSTSAEERAELIGKFNKLETLSEDDIEDCMDITCNGDPVSVKLSNLRITKASFDSRDIDTPVLRSEHIDFEISNARINTKEELVTIDLFGKEIELDELMLKTTTLDILGVLVESNFSNDDVRGVIVGVDIDREEYQMLILSREMDKAAGRHCLKGYDGRHPELMRRVKRAMRSSDSFEHIGTYITPVDSDETHRVTMSYKGANAFGGMVGGSTTAVIRNSDCSIVSIQ